MLKLLTSGMVTNCSFDKSASFRYASLNALVKISECNVTEFDNALNR